MQHDEQPVLVAHEDGSLWWHTTYRPPVALVAGGAPDDDDDTGAGGAGGGGDDDDDGAGDDDDKGGKGGKGGSGDDDPAEAAAKARKEAAQLRKRLRDAEKERDDLKAASMTDAERAEAERAADRERADKATARVQRLSRERHVLALAGSLGIIDSAAAAKLMDADQVEYDDDGEATRESVERALQAAVKEHTFLVRGGGSDGGRKGDAPTGDGKSRLNDWMRGRGSLAR